MTAGILECTFDQRDAHSTPIALYSAGVAAQGLLGSVDAN